MSMIARLVPVCWYTDAKELVSLPKSEQAAQKLIAFTQMVFDQMARDKHDASKDFYLHIMDQSQDDSFDITVFAAPNEPQSKCLDCGYEMHGKQVIQITNRDFDEEAEDVSAIVPGSMISFTANRLHRIVEHSEFGPNEEKSARQLDQFHKLLYRTGAPVPIAHPFGDCQVQVQ
jgi:hypothetical protein